MTVTGITEVSNARVQIAINGEAAFTLYKGEVRSFHLKEGEDIPEEVYREIMETILPKRAIKRAMNLLKVKAYTVKQLTDKLKNSGYPEMIVEEAINYVSSFGYLNDEQYALDYIEYYKESKSRMKIFNSLIQKGISKEIVEESWEKSTEDDNRNLEQEQIFTWMKKKNFNPSEASYEEKQRFSAFLYRKGFQIDSIRCALSLDITSI
ncbi:MAG: regulatory protein RecX [Lachnospiraceae bacterium]|nr:regulatory protein RecX [Lachnospiraceae bacterium]